MVTEVRTLEDNVWTFLERAAAMHGNLAAKRFEEDLHAQLIESEITSPIEDLFMIAATLHCGAWFVDLNPGPELDLKGEIIWPPGIYITSQAKVGKYRVDFLLTQNGIGPNELLTPVVVELDGHAFHDKDKQQRSYEKARDRFLVRQGYRVLHFTGSDVVKDPFKVAFEPLDMLGVFNGLGRPEQYDHRDPLGLGE